MQERSQRNDAQRLVQQWIAGVARLAYALGADVAGDKKRRDPRPDGLTKALDRRDTRDSIRQATV
jgi:hypothetical protein